MQVVGTWSGVATTSESPDGERRLPLSGHVNTTFSCFEMCGEGGQANTKKPGSQQVDNLLGPDNFG